MITDDDRPTDADELEDDDIEDGEYAGDYRCVICGRDRANVERLVAGEFGAICTWCLPWAVSALDTCEGGSPGEHSLPCAQQILETLLRDLEAHPPPDRSGALVGAALALNRGEPAGCRRIASLALNVWDHASAVVAMASIPVTRRSASDMLALSSACFGLGDFARGLDALAALDLGAASPEIRALAELNRALLTLHTDPQASRETVAAARRAITQARATLAWLAAEQPENTRLQDHLATADVALADSALRDGDPATAVTLLRQLTRVAGQSPVLGNLVLGDALATLGDPGGARQAWNEVRRAAHPQTWYAALAVARLGEASPAPPGSRQQTDPSGETLHPGRRHQET